MSSKGSFLPKKPIVTPPSVIIPNSVNPQAQRAYVPAVVRTNNKKK